MYTLQMVVERSNKLINESKNEKRKARLKHKFGVGLLHIPQGLVSEITVVTK